MIVKCKVERNLQKNSKSLALIGSEIVAFKQADSRTDGRKAKETWSHGHINSARHFYQVYILFII